MVGGTPTAASDPMKKQNMVTGILRPTPPSSEIVSAWVRSMTAPTMRKSRSLKNTWFAMCRRPPAMPRLVPTATPSTMYPIWLTVDQMNTSLRLFWSMACTALYSSVNAPIHAVAYMTACCEKRPPCPGIARIRSRRRGTASRGRRQRSSAARRRCSRTRAWGPAPGASASRCAGKPGAAFIQKPDGPSGS